MPPRIDITGQTFRYLTVISPAPAIGRHAHWNARCICGSMVNVRGTDLRAGKRVSCGCTRAQRPSAVPKKGDCHPFVREIFRRLNYEEASQQQIEKRSGINSSTFRKWRKTRAPGLNEIEAVINALGGRLLIRWDVEEDL